MSAITFPSGSGPSPSSNDGPFYSSPFEGNASFAMNPLSAHPPRTPRTSVTTSSHIYGTSIYETKEEVPRDNNSVNDGDSDDEPPAAVDVPTRIQNAAVWRELFLTSNGRDKAFKLMQYSIRLYLLFHTSLTSSRLLRRTTRPALELGLLSRLRSTMSAFSTTRKMLLLFNWLSPLTAIMAQQSVPYSSEVSTEVSKKTIKPFLHTLLYAPPPVLLELVSALADDVTTFARMGLLGKRTGERASRFSDWCWFLASLVGLVENGVERQMLGNLQHDVESRLYAESMTGATAKSKSSSSLDEKELARLRKQDYWLQITRAKLTMDLIFVSYEIFKIKRAAEFVQTVTGLAAAVLSSSKLYDRHKNMLR